MSVLVYLFVNNVYELRRRWAIRRIYCQTFLKQNFDDRMSEVSFVVHSDVLFVPIQSSISNIVFDFSWIGSIVRVSFRDQIVEAAAKGPYIYFVEKHVLRAVFKDFRSAVVQMARKALILEQLFEIIRHSNQIELNDFIMDMNSCRVNITEN